MSRFARWTIACAAGISIGRVVVGVVADVIMPSVAIDASNVEALLVVRRVVMLVSGAVEGACIGVFQWIALRKHTEVTAPRWIGATTLGIGVGWFAGSLATSIEPAGEPTLLTLVFFALLSGVILGAVTGGAQAFAVAARAPFSWAAANAVAWGGAMVVALAGSNLLTAGDRGALAVAVNLGTGALAGLLVGAVTGAALGTVFSQMKSATSIADEKSTDTSV